MDLKPLKESTNLVRASSGSGAGTQHPKSLWARMLGWLTRGAEKGFRESEACSR
ncbi:MAG: hypothetical protein KKB20_15260 [Proteobacteria bacterium]|nr:hypothetical protein [Pseudomonadota bacterium]